MPALEAVDSEHAAPADTPPTEHTPEPTTDSEPESATITELKPNKDVKPGCVS